MVTKVKENSIIMRMNLPPDSQNSASPYARTAKQFSSLAEAADVSSNSTCAKIRSGSESKELAASRGKSLRIGRCFEQEVVFWRVSPIADNYTTADSCFWYRCGPEFEHDIECSDLERNKQSFVEEEVPARPRS